MRLKIGGDLPVLLTARTQPFDFAGDLPTSAELVGGPIVDLNLMVRRDSFARRFARLSLHAPKSILPRVGDTLLFCAEGELQIETREAVATLGPRDAFWGRGGGAIWRLKPKTVGLVYVLEIDRAASTEG